MNDYGPIMDEFIKHVERMAATFERDLEQLGIHETQEGVSGRSSYTREEFLSVSRNQCRIVSEYIEKARPTLHPKALKINARNLNEALTQQWARLCAIWSERMPNEGILHPGANDAEIVAQMAESMLDSLQKTLGREVLAVVGIRNRAPDEPCLSSQRLVAF